VSRCSLGNPLEPAVELGKGSILHREDFRLSLGQFSAALGDLARSDARTTSGSTRDRAWTRVPGLVFPQCSLRIWLHIGSSSEKTLGQARVISDHRAAVSRGPCLDGHCRLAQLMLAAKS